MEQQQEKVISLKAVHEEIKKIMAENGIGDHSISLRAEIAQYYHMRHSDQPNEINLFVSIFISPIIDVSNIRQFSSKNPEHLLSQIREFFIEWNAQKANAEPITDVNITI